MGDHPRTLAPARRRPRFQPAIRPLVVAGGRAAGVGALALVVLLAWAPRAGAHALRISSAPDDGATLKTAPEEVSVTFSETPDPALSALTVLDASGGAHQRGPTTAVPGQPTTLRVAVDHMGEGVYVVTWRTVSQVDGHLASGSFSFGVGIAPADAGPLAAAASSSPPPSPGAVAARWVFYAGVMLAFGGAAVRLFALPTTSRRLVLLVAAGWVMAAVGTVGITQAARSSAGVPISSLLSSSLGHAFVLRAVPLSVTAVAVVALAFARPARRWPAASVAVATAAVMVGDVESTHAAAAHSWRWVQMSGQWIHLAAVSVWIGGLAALVATISTLAPAERARSARRYSAAAGAALALVAATGLQRAVAEVGTWGRLTSTTFGRWVVVKVVVLAGLALLGARNRYRNVPRAESDVGGLRRVGRTELCLAGVALVATGFLQNLAPAAVAAATVAPKPPPPLVVSGNDYGTSVRVSLTVGPGRPGLNRFSASVVDYDSRRPVVADKVSLRFEFPARPDVGTSELVLDRQGDGAYAGQGTNLALDGRWRVVVSVERGADSVEVPLELTTRTATQTITSVVTRGLPTIYTIKVEAGRSIQIYLDPGHPGLNQFHETFLDRDGSEIPMDRAEPTATPPGQSQPQALSTRRLDPVGHFVSDVSGPAGRYHFEVSATTVDGSPVTAHIDIEVH